MNDRPEGWAHSTNQRSLPGPIEESRVKGKGTVKGYLSPILPANQLASTLEPGVRIVVTLELEEEILALRAKMPVERVMRGKPFARDS